MIQDISFGKLDNQFKNIEITDNDVVVCIRGRSVLVNKNAEGVACMPRWSQVKEWSRDWGHWIDAPVIYGFNLQDVNYFIWMGYAEETADDTYNFETVTDIRNLLHKDIYFGLMTAWHIYTWYRANQYCGICGAKTRHDSKERMMRCDSCGNLIFPRIAPAVIIGLTDGDRLMMSMYANNTTKRYGLLAGFIEVGETAEEAVAREVMEEVGLKVKNIRYYKSQPWGIAGNLSLGYFCDLDGDDKVTLDTNELACADWHHRSEMDMIDDGISLTREMMVTFKNGKEPK
ncbi:MAG: NAD(+) diphosphatase [Clostridia bacterium]|nr:NAD(+) diphosphatase [Clostridia bacterium]